MLLVAQYSGAYFHFMLSYVMGITQIDCLFLCFLIVFLVAGLRKGLYFTAGVVSSFALIALAIYSGGDHEIGNFNASPAHLIMQIGWGGMIMMIIFSCRPGLYHEQDLGIKIKPVEIYFFGMFVGVATNKTIYFFNEIIPYYQHYYHITRRDETFFIILAVILTLMVYSGVGFVVEQKIRHSKSIFLRQFTYQITSLTTLTIAAFMIIGASIGFLRSLI